jgi:hypothetical protein
MYTSLTEAVTRGTCSPHITPAATHTQFISSRRINADLEDVLANTKTITSAELATYIGKYVSVAAPVDAEIDENASVKVLQSRSLHAPTRLGEPLIKRLLETTGLRASLLVLVKLGFVSPGAVLDVAFSSLSDTAILHVLVEFESVFDLAKEQVGLISTLAGQMYATDEKKEDGSLSLSAVSVQDTTRFQEDLVSLAKKHQVHQSGARAALYEAVFFVSHLNGATSKQKTTPTKYAIASLSDPGWELLAIDIRYGRVLTRDECSDCIASLKPWTYLSRLADIYAAQPSRYPSELRNDTALVDAFKHQIETVSLDLLSKHVASMDALGMSPLLFSRLGVLENNWLNPRVNHHAMYLRALLKLKDASTGQRPLLAHMTTTKCPLVTPFRASLSDFFCRWAVEFLTATDVLKLEERGWFSAESTRKAAAESAQRAAVVSAYEWRLAYKFTQPTGLVKSRPKEDDGERKEK